MHPADWLDPAAAARRGTRRRHQGRRLVPPHQPLASDGGSRRSAAASAATGAAVLVHCEVGTAAHEIIDLLEAAGATAGPDRPRPHGPQPGLGAPRGDRRARRHARVRHDRADEVPPRQRGARPDRARRRRRPPRAARCWAWTSARASYLRAYDGGPGLRYLMAAFAPRLRRRLGDDAAARILVANPARFYAVPRRRGAPGVSDRYDVVVVGAGSAGSTAAIAAARPGRARCSWTGSRSWAAPRPPCSTRSTRSTRRATGRAGSSAASGWEVARRLTADGVAFERPNTYGAGTGVTYDAEALKVVWERLAEDAGVDLLLHTWATGVRRGRTAALAAVRLWNKGGERWVEARCLRRCLGRRRRLRDGRRPARRTRRRRHGPVALDAVQGRQRRHRAGVGGAEGGALGADGARPPRRAPTGCRGSRAPGTARRTRAWR